MNWNEHRPPDQTRPDATRDAEASPDSSSFGLPIDAVSRRRFLTLLGASAAFAAGSGCSRIDRGTILPAARKLPEAVPGAAVHYATTFSEGLDSYSVLVKTREGRPIHVQGNDLDPLGRGAAPLRAVADVLRLYDPDRLRHSLIDGTQARWDDAVARLVRGVSDASAARRPVVLLTGAMPSPTRRALVADLARVLPTLEHVRWEPVVSDEEQAALRACFGNLTRPRPRLERARALLAIEADPLGDGAPEVIAAFADQRRPAAESDAMNRLWVAEARLSLTGSKADQRLPLRPALAARLAFALARSLHALGLPLPAGISAELLAPFEPALIARENGVPPAQLRALASDLAAARGAALVLVGPCLPAAAHVAGHLLNAMLEADSHTLDVGDARDDDALATLADVRALLERMATGKVGAAIFWGANPAYSYPDEGLVHAALERTPVRAAIALHRDETVSLCSLAFAEHHWLESWGDHAPRPDLFTLQQPALLPLFDTRPGEDVLLALLNRLAGTAATEYAEYLKERWRREVHAGRYPVPFERFWHSVLHDGVLSRPATPRPTRRLQSEAVATAARAAAQDGPSRGLDLLITRGPLHDGRYSNNGWLQELPDPVTKLTWGNVLSLSPADAHRLGLSDGALIRVQTAGAVLTAPVFVQSGQADGVATLALGHGRQTGGVANGVGVNAFRLLLHSGGPALLRDVSISPTAASNVLPPAQPHQRIEGRDIVRSVTRAQHVRRLAAPPSESEPLTLYPSAAPAQHKWVMAIDLSACVGCSACAIACQSENNIPVVGPEQVRRGRVMHWMRIDRYYEGDSDRLRVLTQPMLCQQCDHAPCEPVCPVNATTHSAEGLNQMTYNRCVGTRYCANNCPYKVRRFNYLDFTGMKTAPETLVFNPEVSVRPRGVMEKCTFCVQRIEEARAAATVAGRPMRDGDVTPACAAACPAAAIVFGDLMDPASRVAKLARDPRGYRVLAELGVRPAITYLYELKNPPEIPAASDDDPGGTRGR